MDFSITRKSIIALSNVALILQGLNVTPQMDFIGAEQQLHVLGFKHQLYFILEPSIKCR